MFAGREFAIGPAIEPRRSITGAIRPPRPARQSGPAVIIGGDSELYSAGPGYGDAPLTNNPYGGGAYNGYDKDGQGSAPGRTPDFKPTMPGDPYGN